MTEAIGLRVKRGAENTGGKHENSIAGTFGKRWRIPGIGGEID